jgi:hypothetical protein
MRVRLQKDPLFFGRFHYGECLAEVCPEWSSRYDEEEADVIYVNNREDILEYRWDKGWPLQQCLPSLDCDRTFAISAPFCEKLRHYASLRLNHLLVGFDADSVPLLKDVALGHISKMSSRSFESLYVLDYDAIFLFLQDALPLCLIELVHGYLYAMREGPNVAATTKVVQ